MECKLQNFSIGADGGGGLMTLLADQYEVDLFACPQCGRVELYTAGYSRAPRRAPYWCEHCGKEREDRLCPECHQVCDLMEDPVRPPLTRPSLPRMPTRTNLTASVSPGRSGRSPPGRGDAPDRRRLNRFVTEN